MVLEFNVRRGLSHVSYKQFVPVIREFVEQVKNVFRDNLVSIVLFGSVARGDCREDSDIDMLVVMRNLPQSFFKRIDLFIPIIEKARENASSKPLIQVYPLTVDEAAKNRPIYLDMLTDAIIIYDRDKFIEKVLERLWLKLKGLGAKKVKLKDGSWLWMLKPDIKPGEVVEI